MNKNQRESFKRKIDKLYEIMKNGERKEFTVKDTHSPHIFHFVGIRKTRDRLYIEHLRGTDFKIALTPIIERATYPRSEVREEIKFKKQKGFPSYMRIIPDCSQVDMVGLFKELDLVILELL